MMRSPLLLILFLLCSPLAANASYSFNQSDILEEEEEDEWDELDEADEEEPDESLL